MKKTRRSRLRTLDPDPRTLPLAELTLAVGWLLDCGFWPSRQELRKLVTRSKPQPEDDFATL